VTTPVSTEAPTPSPLPLPSPTPFMYTVVENDTMIGISSRFGITLDELQVANPDVNPNILSVGTQLIIPVDFEDEEEADEQVLPLTEGEMECYQVRSGGIWCYWMVTNSLDQPLENISGVIRLYDGMGQELASKGAVPLLNLLEAGMRTPLVAFFEPPNPTWNLAQGQLLTAVDVNQYSERYILGSLEEQTVSIDQDGLQADISGKLKLTIGQLPEYVWVLAVAYDAEDSVVGIRRWEAPQDQLTETPSFEMQVFSLGRPIDHVDVLFEARSLTTQEIEN
jgi:LysM repeat protein